MTITQAVMDAECAAVANGPEGESGKPRRPTRGVSMRVARDNVGRLRQRIFKAAQAGDHKKVRSLQKLMVRHEARVFRTGVKDRHRLIVVAVG